MRAAHQRGFTLLEIMIAMSIGLFLAGALITVVQTNKTVFLNQNQLEQMQDGQRMAMTLMADVIQSTGYFPDPTTNTLGSTLGASGAFANSQAMTGAAGDTISVRYMTASGDGILNCSGLSNTTGANTIYVNQFAVVGNQLLVGWGTWNGPESSLTLEIFTNSRSPFPAQQARAWTGALVLIAGILILSLTARAILLRRSRRT